MELEIDVDADDIESLTLVATDLKHDYVERLSPDIFWPIHSDEWLENNKHIKAVTRDRASAYASAIEEVLPDAMQIADRFHLHQNLLETVRSILNSSIPSTIKIPVNAENDDFTEENIMIKKDFEIEKTEEELDNFFDPLTREEQRDIFSNNIYYKHYDYS